ncbi:type II toxin-antitoxin system Phd/YefM family antitoxin [Geotalea uraniireducens]|uniref:Antitoxin n=1 Tax=Geotalea uraniireducens (strain Rf4) TaxID=351605 RepID=A5GDU8_GEOUR|nr:type II toxin-antitoxin system Phd/YefM family antitoxin [Geotalea uraniireducens]ABQ24255.1 prevent-host-death family protein [Geotalea uraniireducens Rf4]
MRSVTATELARNFRVTLDAVEYNHEEFIIVRNNHEVARIIPGPSTMTAMEAMADIYRTLPEEAAAGWLRNSRQIKDILSDEVRDPWDS